MDCVLIRRFIRVSIVALRLREVRLGHMGTGGGEQVMPSRGSWRVLTGCIPRADCQRESLETAEDFLESLVMSSQGCALAG
ncbi:hypothetical protein AAFF_G00117210 [Aldrovandia affinis]|uniref:Uncharacterized protein n=1 Tax=Aldrovandia affinis TaxID=143900 RepID=A0AAD7WXL0_9TELE|nr:hypothetical protein AAFF_G00117210 [Aldrovandia affinis]